MRKRAWPKNQGWHGQNQMPFFLVFIETLTYNIQQELACSKTFPSTGPFCLRLTGLVSKTYLSYPDSAFVYLPNQVYLSQLMGTRTQITWYVPLCYLSTRIALVAPCCLDEPCLWTTSSSPVAASFIFVSFRLVYAWRTQTNHVINVPCFNWLNTLMNSRTKDICLQLHARQIPAFSDERLHHAVVTDMQMNR